MSELVVGHGTGLPTFQGEPIELFMPGDQIVLQPRIDHRCTEIADQVVPTYRSGYGYSCTSPTAKRWQAAWDAACIALGGDPEDYRGFGPRDPETGKVVR